MGANWTQYGATGISYYRRWLLCLPMLAIVNSTSGYSLISMVLTALFLLYFTKWSPYFKLYRAFAYLISLLRYRRVEKHCESCEQSLLLQLNSRRLKRVKRSGSSCSGSSDEESMVKTPQLIGWRLRSVRRFPWRLFSRNWGRLVNTRLRPDCLNTFFIWLYAKGFGCNLDEAQMAITEYKTLGSFFTRRLKDGIRPVDYSGSVVSPADGTLSHVGQFRGGYLEQVKGVHYSLNYFLGLETTKKTAHASASEKALADSLLHNKDGSHVLMQMVIYLSPGDYHRFHSPTDWTIQTRRYNLFCWNKRKC